MILLGQLNEISIIVIYFANVKLHSISYIQVIAIVILPFRLIS